MVTEEKCQRLIDATSDFCLHLIPDDILPKLKVPLSSNPSFEEIEDAKTSLYEIFPVYEGDSVTIKIYSKYRNIRGILIGAQGKNVAAMRHLLKIIGKQERIGSTQITIIHERPANDEEEKE